ncbi:retrovirus-related Pol polyprotein from transposon 17.6 [Trichonephila clavipes]|nr:retrovirus-related Pol polyprotein from transposon 17.6 [Trichonephila clavipes]
MFQPVTGVKSLIIKNALPAGRLKYIVSKYPNEIVTLDLVGPYPASRPERYKFILVITDHFTKWCELIPLRKASAQTIANAFFNTYIARYGAPISLISDNDPQFISDVFEHLSHRLDIKHMKTVTYRPQSNLTERVNRNLVQMIASLLKKIMKTGTNLYTSSLSHCARRATGRKQVGKFMPKFEGPYKVLEIKGNNLVIWKHGRNITVNIDQVRVYRPRQSDTISSDSPVQTLYDEQEVSHGSNRSHQGQFKEHRKTSSQESEGCRSRQGLLRLQVDPEWKLVDVITRPVRPERQREDTKNKRRNQSGRIKPIQGDLAHTIYGAVYKKKDGIPEELSNIEINGIPGSTFRRRSLSMEALNGDPVHRFNSQNPGEKKHQIPLLISYKIAQYNLTASWKRLISWFLLDKGTELGHKIVPVRPPKF